MGRPKRSAAADVDTEAMEVDKAEKARIGREKAKKSYREDSESEDEAVVAVKEDKDFSDEEDALSVSESEGSNYGESSGSEYGKKKKPAAKKGRAVGRGRGRKSASPAKGKGRGRGRPPASSAAKNGKKAAPAKRGRDSEDESESEAGSSGSEFGKKKKPVISPKKRATPAAKAKPAGKKRGAAASSPAPERTPRRGRASASKSYREMSEDDIEEVSDVDKPVTKKAKLEAKPKPAKKIVEKKKEESASEEEEESIEEEEDEEVDGEKKAEKKVIVKKNGTPPAKKTKEDDEDDEDVEMEEEEEVEEEEDEKKDKEKVDDKKEAQVAKNGNNGHGSSASDGSEDEEEDDEKLKDDKSENGSVGEAKEEKSALKNKTDTDYTKIDFETSKKTDKGEPWNYKIACWNIGGIKAWLNKNGLEYLVKEDPDILCLNEVKCSEKTKPEDVSKLEKYPHLYWSYNSENSGHSGVAIFSKQDAISVQYGLPENDDDSTNDKKLRQGFNKEGRLITLEFEEFYLINTYVPNAGRAEKTEKYPKGYPPKVENGERLKFDEFFRDFIKELEKKKSVIVTGDLNVAHEEIDLANPKTNDRTAGFTKEEREGMTKLLKETTLFDTFRALYPDQKDRYSFWSYMHNSRQKNTGWRLDYFLMSEKLRDSLCDSVMRTEVYGSDHCPIVLFMRK